MPKFLIMWNSGQGFRSDVIEADNQEDADNIACETGLSEMHGYTDYLAVPFTKENAEEFGVDYEAST